MRVEQLTLVMAAFRDAEGVRVGGRFLLGEVLGEGSFSVVYAALDEMAGTPVALKVIRRDAGDSALQEASLLSAARHPNVVAYYASGRESGGVLAGRVWIAMQLADRTLTDFVHSTGGRIPWSVLRPIVVDVLRGLAYLHGQRPPVLHRDIKPDNVLDFGGGWALGDLGISTDEPISSHGAINFAAPEVITGEIATVRSDLWSLGTLITRCLGDEGVATLEPQVAALVASLTAADVDARPVSALQALSILEPTLPTPQEPTRRPRHAEAGDDTLEPVVPARTNRGRMVALTVAATVAVVAAIVGGVQLARDSERPRQSGATSAPLTTVALETAEFSFDQFSSPSKNIGCRMTASFARCDIRRYDGPNPPPRPTDCEGDWGTTLLVDADGRGRFECVSDSELGSANVVPYGEANEVGGFVCRSESSGVQCINKSTAHGFAIARGGYRLF